MILRRAFALILSLLPTLAFAGLPLRASLEELATGADHILVGRITGVDMIDASGNAVTDPSARTGPGSGKQIRLRIEVDKTLLTNAQSVPSTLHVPLDSSLHYTLGQIQAAHRVESPQLLVFLKGPQFEAIKAGVFLRRLSDQESALKVRGLTP